MIIVLDKSSIWLYNLFNRTHYVSVNILLYIASNH